LNGRQQERHEHADNSDDYQEFDESESRYSQTGRGRAAISARCETDSMSSSNSMLHRSTPRAANIDYIKVSTFPKNWVHQFVCLFSGSTSAGIDSSPNLAPHGLWPQCY
jgi:hypothetical protein